MSRQTVFIMGSFFWIFGLGFLIFMTNFYGILILISIIGAT